MNHERLWKLKVPVPKSLENMFSLNWQIWSIFQPILKNYVVSCLQANRETLIMLFFYYFLMVTTLQFSHLRPYILLIYHRHSYIGLMVFCFRKHNLVFNPIFIIAFKTSWLPNSIKYTLIYKTWAIWLWGYPMHLHCSKWPPRAESMLFVVTAGSMKKAMLVFTIIPFYYNYLNEDLMLQLGLL